MRIRLGITALVFALVVPLSSSGAMHSDTHIFAEPIDALSVAFSYKEAIATVRGFGEEGWTKWYELEVEDEHDPLLMESNLVTFPYDVERIEIRSTDTIALHPIRVSDAPIQYQVAARRLLPNAPRILSRREWGADESFLFTSKTASQVRRTNAREAANADAPSPRVEDCNEAQKRYPEEFRVSQTVREDNRGRTYRWPLQYSEDINMIVVHHTAQLLRGDNRSAVERVRALYTFHAQNRGWGDIGYNYIIDEAGQIYEGRTGGEGVVGGHAYCNNIGSIGVALLGNFELEKPSLKQIQALQWLLSDLANRNNIDLEQNVRFHGKTVEGGIAGHGQVVSTECPGYYLRETLDQVTQNVRTGNLFAGVNFPSLLDTYVDRTADRRAQRLAQIPISERITTTSTPINPRRYIQTGLSPIGDLRLLGTPGQQVAFSLRYRNDDTTVSALRKLADVKRSDDEIGVWLERNGRFVRVQDEIVAPETIGPNEEHILRLKVQLPNREGPSRLTIDGDIEYWLEAEGRTRNSRARAPTVIRSALSSRERPARSSPTRRTATPVIQEKTQHSLRTFTPTRSAASSREPESPTVRIKLSFEGNEAELDTARGARVNGIITDGRTVTLKKIGNECIAYNGKNVILQSNVVRVDAEDRIIDIGNWERTYTAFRGVIECRILSGNMVLINELPIEMYLAGLGEEPDTEPYEKQRAFAIAARSYTYFYMQDGNTKFPGKPYHGSDSPREFQLYLGADMEDRHPEWVRAVEDTKGKVLTVKGDILKAPYFSSSDGRTRSPEEIGWASFPHAEVLQSKEDPGCIGLKMAGHGVGMSGCGSEWMANNRKKAEEILNYYYDGAEITKVY